MTSLLPETRVSLNLLLIQHPAVPLLDPPLTLTRPHTLALSRPAYRTRTWNTLFLTVFTLQHQRSLWAACFLRVQQRRVGLLDFCTWSNIWLYCCRTARPVVMSETAIAITVQDFYLFLMFVFVPRVCIISVFSSSIRLGTRICHLFLKLTVNLHIRCSSCMKLRRPNKKYESCLV